MYVMKRIFDVKNSFPRMKRTPLIRQTERKGIRFLLLYMLFCMILNRFRENSAIFEIRPVGNCINLRSVRRTLLVFESFYRRFITSIFNFECG